MFCVKSEHLGSNFDNDFMFLFKCWHQSALHGEFLIKSLTFYLIKMQFCLLLRWWKLKHHRGIDLWLGRIWQTDSKVAVKTFTISDINAVYLNIGHLKKCKTHMFLPWKIENPMCNAEDLG